MNVFLDVVDSTGRATCLGGSSAVLNDRARMRGKQKRFGDREVNTFGDDFLALFDAQTQDMRCARSGTPCMRRT